MERLRMRTIRDSMEPVLHLRFNGQSRDIPLSSLALPNRPTDPQVKAALARHLDVAERELDYHVLERHQNGNLTFRPEAVYG